MELKAHAKEADVHMQQQTAPSQPKTSLLEEEDHRSSCIIDKYDSTASEEKKKKKKKKKIPREQFVKRRREYDHDRVAKIFMDEAAGAEAQELYFKKHLSEGPRRVRAADSDYTTEAIARRSFHRSVPDSDPNEKLHLGGNQHGARKIIADKELTTGEPFKMGHVYPAQLEHANIMKVIHKTMKAKNSIIEYDHAGGFIKGQEEISYWATGLTGIEAVREMMKYTVTRRDLLRSSVLKEIIDAQHLDKRPAPAVEEEEDKRLATTTCGTDVAADDMVLEPERLTEEAALKKEEEEEEEKED